MCTPSRGRARCTRPPSGIHPRGREAPEHAAGDAGEARAGHIIEPVWFVMKDRGCRAQPAADRGADALAEVARGETGRVPRNESVVAPHDVDLAAQVVTEPTRVVLCPRGEAPLEGRDQVPPVGAYVLTAGFQAIGDGTHADIQSVELFRHVPGI